MIKYNFHVFFTLIPQKPRCGKNLFFWLLISFIFFSLNMCCLPPFIYVHFFLICSFSEVHVLFGGFGCFQLRNMKQLLAQCDQPGRPGLCLLSVNGGRTSSSDFWLLAFSKFCLLSCCLLFFSVFSCSCRLQFPFLSTFSLFIYFAYCTIFD